MRYSLSHCFIFPFVLTIKEPLGRRTIPLPIQLIHPVKRLRSRTRDAPRFFKSAIALHVVGSLIRETGKIDVPNLAYSASRSKEHWEPVRLPEEPLLQRLFFPDTLQFKHHLFTGLSFSDGNSRTRHSFLHIFPRQQPESNHPEVTRPCKKETLVGFADHHVIIIPITEPIPAYSPVVIILNSSNLVSG